MDDFWGNIMGAVIGVVGTAIVGYIAYIWKIRKLTSKIETDKKNALSEAIKKLEDWKVETNELMNHNTARFGGYEQCLTQHEQKINAIDFKYEFLNGRFGEMEDTVERISASVLKLASLEDYVKGINETFVASFETIQGMVEEFGEMKFEFKGIKSSFKQYESTQQISNNVMGEVKELLKKIKGIQIENN